jgi:translocation and assembly module TamB
MTRRRLVALVSVAVLFVLGLVVLSTGLFVTRTSAGRGKLRDIVAPIISRAVHGGTVYLGNLSGSFIGDLTIDSVAIRDKRGDLFLSTGRITLQYNWRDLIDYRISITRATVEHPFVHLVRHEDGVWNFKQIFARPKPTIQTPQISARGWGDYIVLDSVSARNGTVLLSMPWHPEDSLRGARRDSAIRVHLEDPDRGVSRTFEGFARTYAWTKANGLLSHVRLADPDSDRAFGREIKIATLAVDEINPTFKFRNVRGDVRLQGDSAWFTVPHFDMHASTGRGNGKVWWGSDLPTRYDIAVRGDSVSLDDVNWVYPTLPRTGGGTLDLAIKNDPRNLQVVNFELKNMDVRSTGSHLTGEMWFGTGAPVLLVRNVDVRATPINFDLIRTLNGKPFPVDWRGELTGTVKARGGPLTNFVVDDARAMFVDRHVPGAVSRFTGKGGLDILYPAETKFHDFDVDVGALDLRTIEYLYPSFPKLGGMIAGTATLDSSYLDVRFSNAHLVHQDGPGAPSQASGSGRVTYGTYMNYDMTLNAEPLNLTMLARSPQFEGLPIGGLWSGPIRVRGTAPDLELSTSLQSSFGALSFDGRVDIDSIGGLGAHGRGQFGNLNLAGLLDAPAFPQGDVSGHYDIDLAGETASSLTGSATLALEPATLDSIHVFPSEARLRFAEGRVLVDSLRLHTRAATLVASGGIGLPQGRPDTLRFTLTVDSLGGLRPIISHPDTTLLGARATPPDSLAGSITVRGVASGTVDALSLTGRLSANDITFNTQRGGAVSGTFDLHDALTSPSGTVAVHADTVALGGIKLDTLGGVLHFDDPTHARFAVDVLSRNGPTAALAGRWRHEGGAGGAGGAQIVDLDSLGLTVAQSTWHLAQPTQLTFDTAATRLDSLVLRSGDSASVMLLANVPNVGPAFAQLRALGIPLRDVGTIAQLEDTLSGTANLAATITGTKAAPNIEARAELGGIEWGNVKVDRVSSSAQYANGRVVGDLELVRNGQTAVTASASWPYDITLFSATPRKDVVSAVVTADTTDLSIIAPFLAGTVDSLHGRVAGRVTVSGTTAAKSYEGHLAVRDAVALIRPAGITLRSISGTVSGNVNAAGQDSIGLQFGAQTSNRDSVALTGWVRNLSQANGQTAFSLALDADSLHAFNRRTVADLYITTPEPLRLTGTLNAPTLSGSINVDRGSIYLADRDLARKLAVEAIADTTAGALSGARSPLVTKLMSNLQIAGVPVTLGQDVRLRSAEANVRLGGQLNLETTDARMLSSSGELVPGLTLEGQLTTLAGTYNLNLGLVQREFAVLPGGTVTFDGGSPETPLVDISARYNVKQPRDRDLGVIVRLQGRMPSPAIEFSSDADYTIAASDLISYLLTGQPGFDFGANPQAAQVLSSFLAPTLSAVAADRLRRSLGSWVDAFQLQFGNYGGAQTGFSFQSNVTNYLRSATIETGKQLTSDLYLSVNTGICQLQTGSFRGVGAKLEYRFDPTLSLQTAYDPPTTTSTCNETQQFLFGTTPTPAQISFALRHTWRF